MCLCGRAVGTADGYDIYGIRVATFTTLTHIAANLR